MTAAPDRRTIVRLHATSARFLLRALACASVLVLGATPVAQGQAPRAGGPSIALVGDADLPRAEPEDYRTSAGRVEGGVHVVALSIQEAAWLPWGDDGAALRAHVFVAEGAAPRVPGPLIRVTAGTPVHVTLRNQLRRTVVVRGLSERGGQRTPDRTAAFRDSVAIAPGAKADVRFTPTVPGTFVYYGRALAPGDRVSPRFFGGDGPDAPFAGVLIVDAPGEVPTPGERIFVITQWGHGSIPSSVDPGYRFMINGRSWPHAERLALVQGDTAHWRVMNISGIHHPMHLHGFHFRVDAHGDQHTETVFAPDARRMVVTETLDVGETMRMRWVAEEPGNWIFHCHLMLHMAGRQAAPLGPVVTAPSAAADTSHAHPPATQAGASHAAHADGPLHEAPGAPADGANMGGLVLGVRVTPRAGAATSSAPAHRLHLHVRKRAGALGDSAAYGFVLQQGDRPPAADSVVIPGSTLVLERGRTTEIVVHNGADFMLGVHWHGLQLESRFDGVPGWSGMPGSLMRPIAPADSYVVRITPPRAGTFMYHVHSEPGHQLAQGLYGALLVMEPGEPRDVEHDRTILLASLGTERFPAPVVNGRTAPEPMTFRAGEAYRLRFMHISPDDLKDVELVRDGEPVSWIPIAKDGADLPLVLRHALPARFRPHVGETYDFAWTPEPGDYILRVVTTFSPGPRAFRTLEVEPHTVEIAVRVR